MKFSFPLLVFAATFSLGSILPVHSETARTLTALDEYVAMPDDHFRYSLVRTQALNPHPVTLHVLKMTSQKWRDLDEVNQPVWWHWMALYIPEKVSHDTAFLFISGGSNKNDAPTRINEPFAQMALRTESVVIELGMIPNQPLQFKDLPETNLSEDSFIAYTWDKFLRTGDSTWPARLPMTKAAVRAMDTVSQYTSLLKDHPFAIRHFVVGGGSKRGWTTWMTAAVDPRVVAIVPIVIDVLNLVPSMKHHYRAYGFFAPAVGDYVHQHIMDWMDRPEFSALMKIEDPYEYRSRFTMPKLILNSAGDQFFLPDSWQFYLKDLPGETNLRYVPNTDHGVNRGSDAFDSVLSFYEFILAGAKRPQLDWNVTCQGEIQATSETKPSQVLLWQATNPETRDFRLETFGPKWTSTPLAPSTPNGSTYRAQPNQPEKGWTAFFIEFTYPGPGKTPLKLTTGIQVTPQTLPHGDFQPEPIHIQR